MADPSFPLFPILTFITFVVTLIPLPWHLQQWNAGTCAFMLWTSSVCFVFFVNSLVWSGSVANVAPVWCDIASQIIIAANAGLAASTVCISRRLYYITALKGAYATKAEVRLFPQSSQHLIVQPYRFQIIEDVGCYPSTYNSLLAYVLYYMWSIALGLVALVYACLALRQYHIRRAELSKLMPMKTIDSDKTVSAESLTVSRYFRLMVLALIHVVCTIPLGIYSIYLSATQMPTGVAQGEPKRNWTHVQEVPSSVWRADPVSYGLTEMNRWMYIFCGLLFFAIFGFASEARKRYKMWWNCIGSRVRRGNGGECFPRGLRHPSWRWTPNTSRNSKMSETTIVGSENSIKHLLSHERSYSSSTYKPSDVADSDLESVQLHPMSASESPANTPPTSGNIHAIPVNRMDRDVEANDENAVVYYIDPVYGLMTKNQVQAIYPPPAIAL
ncbi:a-factor receptor [Paramarasmius palmivorus]|uniref:A-factor receptor n=1 Tax=Paramarasmius palmivorus TaxID=297713 RepID=A0AAW0C153_9AGAR